MSPFRLILVVLVFAQNVAFGQDAGSAGLSEKHQTFSVGPGVRAHIMAPLELSAGKPVHLVIYALPNGNTIEETLGRAVPPGDKSRYGIQQIAAQTRFLWEKADKNLVVALVEARGLAWPAWRKRHGDAKIPRIVDALVARFAPSPVRVTLSAHSGGGSFIFGYINAFPEIPSRIERIALLDANYAYDGEKHAAKLANWLAASRSHRLVVLAYRDHVARWNGKPFVSEAGGTAGRAKAMQADLAHQAKVIRSRSGDLDVAKAANGRAHFYIHRNPSEVILHTVQVERNGFIHSLLSGTRHANRGYRYMSEPAYSRWITPG